jgi:hypothetical protein
MLSSFFYTILLLLNRALKLIPQTLVYFVHSIRAMSASMKNPPHIEDLNSPQGSGNLSTYEDAVHREIDNLEASRAAEVKQHNQLVKQRWYQIEPNSSIESVRAAEEILKNVSLNAGVIVGPRKPTAKEHQAAIKVREYAEWLLREQIRQTEHRLEQIVESISTEAKKIEPTPGDLDVEYLNMEDPDVEALMVTQWNKPAWSLYYCMEQIAQDVLAIDALNGEQIPVENLFNWDQENNKEDYP